MKKFDLHVHFIPPKYMERYMKVNTRFTEGTDANGNRVLYSGGSRVLTLTDAMLDLEARIKEMDIVAPGIVQVLSLSIPNVYMEDKEKCVELTQLVNDEFVKIRKEHPDRFLCLASMPFPHVEAAIEEMERTLLDLKMNGIAIGTNILGQYLDSEELFPFFKRANELNATIFLHPMPPVGVEKMTKYSLAPLVGFVFDTTLTVSRMIFSGLMEKCPDIRFIIPHLGGTIPYLMGRIDIGWNSYPEARSIISKPPSYYIRRLYFDVISYNPAAIECCRKIVGADHMLLGSDYPHVIGDVKRVIEALDQVSLSEQERELIYSGNALRILNNLS